jgi:hypothetical protein
MPSMVVQAQCPACGQVRKFMEFKAEPCGPQSPFERRYGFRCLSCKTLVNELVDVRGARHSFVEGTHVEA